MGILNFITGRDDRRRDREQADARFELQRATAAAREKRQEGQLMLAKRKEDRGIEDAQLKTQREDTALAAAQGSGVDPWLLLRVRS